MRQEIFPQQKRSNNYVAAFNLTLWGLESFPAGAFTLALSALVTGTLYRGKGFFRSGERRLDIGVGMRPRKENRFKL